MNQTSHAATPEINPNQEELWEIIPGFGGRYFASSLGRIKSTKGREKILSQCIGTRGYAAVGLYRDKKQKMFRVHRVVLLSFSGPCPAGHVGAHLDGDKLNNRASNLCWVTPSENERHKASHGTSNCNTNAKLKAVQIPEIKELRDLGLSYREIGNRFSVSHECIRHIFIGRTWKN